MGWLRTREAEKSAQFFRQLGEFDQDRKWLLKLEQMGEHDDGAIPFAFYFGGLGEHDRQFTSERLDELTESRRVSDKAILRATALLGDGSAGVERVERLTREQLVDPFIVPILLSSSWVQDLELGERLRLLEALVGAELENAMAIVESASVWIEDFEEPIEGELADFLWRCLEVANPQYANVYYCDQLASVLTRSDPERGFLLLENLLTRSYGSGGSWEPASSHGSNKFWMALYEADHERALRLVLSLAAKNSSLTFRITRDFRGMLDQEGDARFLIAFALEKKRQAEVVAQVITAARPGFWPIVLKILEKYPEKTPANEVIQSGIELGILRSEGGGYSWVGSQADYLESCCKEVEQVLRDDATPTIARSWFEGFEEHLRDRVEEERVSEADTEMTSYRSGGVQEDSEAPDRLFAIRRLLETGKLDRVLQLLSPTELLSLLPKLRLPKDETEKIQRGIERS